jgi:hypothetical protein
MSGPPAGLALIWTPVEKWLLEVARAELAAVEINSDRDATPAALISAWITAQSVST